MLDEDIFRDNTADFCFRCPCGMFQTVNVKDLLTHCTTHSSNSIGTGEVTQNNNSCLPNILTLRDTEGKAAPW